jgi:uncharacterized protein YecE (DUF72 family)
MSTPGTQRDLFALPPPSIPPAPPRPEHGALAARLPPGIRFGTMSWNFPGWAGLVYGAGASNKHLAGRGLTAYAQHPLLRAVELDRTYYEPLSADAYGSYAAQVPEDFRFLVKAHEECTVFRFPPHARYGKRRGELNGRFLDAEYACGEVVAPFVEGLGAQAGVLLFQCPPQPLAEPGRFAERLHDFLRRLPRGPTYAVELRNADLFTPAYGAALADAGAVHCHNIWTAMPPLLFQARQIPPSARRPLIVRWLLRPGDLYEDARQRFAPFDRVQEEDLASRAALATLIAKASQHGVPALIAVNNKAEGCAPESIVRLARAIADQLPPADPADLGEIEDPPGPNRG